MIQRTLSYSEFRVGRAGILTNMKKVIIDCVGVYKLNSRHAEELVALFFLMLLYN